MFQKIAAALITLSIIASANLATAGTVKVIQKKGSKAIIEGPFVSTLAVGATYDVGEGTSVASSSATRNVAGISGKKYVFSGTTLFSYSSSKNESATTGVSSNSTSISIFGGFGFVMNQFELGPILGYTSISTGSYSFTSTSIGGYFDYNLTSPTMTNIVFGPTASIALISSSGINVSNSGNQIVLGGFLKWFPVSLPFAVRSTLTYKIGKNNSSLNGDTETSSLGLGAGFSLYF
jgi:hypothetical protein